MSSLEKRLERYMRDNSPMAMQMGYKPSMSPEELEKEAEEILGQLREYKGDKKKTKMAVSGAQFIIMHYTMKAMKVGMSSAPGGPVPGPGGPGGPGGPPMAMPDTKVIAAFHAEQKKDMLVAWNLLQGLKFKNQDMGKASLMLKVDISQRLEDGVKLASVFEELTSKQLGTQELMVAFTAAPFLADWKATFNLAKRFMKQMPGGNLDQFHMMSQAMPIPDYSVLYKMAEEYELNKKETPKPEDLQWETIEVASIRVRFRDVSCGKYEKKREELLTEINKTPIDWEAVPTNPTMQIKRLGGFLQTMSFGELPMSLCGPYLEGKIHVRGYTELVLEPNAAGQNRQPPQMMDPRTVAANPNMTVIVQDEEWKLEVTDPKATTGRIWKGSYSLKQLPRVAKDDSNPDNAPVLMDFDLEVYEKGADIPPTEQKDDEKQPAAGAAAIEATKGKEAPKVEKKDEEGVKAILTEIDDLTLD